MQITSIQKSILVALFESLTSFATITNENSFELNFAKYVQMCNTLKAFGISMSDFASTFGGKRDNMKNIDFLFVTLGKSFPSSYNELSIVENGVIALTIAEPVKEVKTYAKKELFKHAPVAHTENKITLFETIGKGFGNKQRTGLKWEGTEIFKGAKFSKVVFKGENENGKYHFERNVPHFWAASVGQNNNFDYEMPCGEILMNSYTKNLL